MPSDAMIRQTGRDRDGPAPGPPRDPDRHAGAADGAVELMGIRLHDIPSDEIVARVVDAARSGRKMLVVNANAHLVVLSQTQTWLRGMFRAADIAFCDGAGVQVAGRLLGIRLVHRSTPPVWVAEAMSRLGSDGSVFWVGGTQATVVRAAAAYEACHGVRTVGMRNGYFDASPGSEESAALIEEINRARPSILIVAMGMPRQERWLWDNWSRIEAGVSMTGGALVDHAAGTVRRPRQWVSDAGLEWMVRLYREPRRLWRRYLLGLPIFGLYVIRYAVGRGYRQG